MSPEYRRTGVGMLASAFTPAKIADLKLWLAADRITGLANNDPIGTWPDLSGNGNDPTQVTAAKQPLYKTAVLNGYPAVRFDGIDDYLSRASFASISQPDTVIIVQQFRTLPASSKYFFDTGGVGRQIVRSNNVTPVWGVFAGITVNDGSTDTNANILTTVFNNTANQFYLNGTSQTLGAPGTNSLDQPVTLGAAVGGTSLFADIDLFEVIIYAKALTIIERQKLERYLGNKYAITVN